MRDLFENLSQKEKKIIKIVILIFCFSLFFLIFVLTWERGRISTLKAELNTRKKSLAQAQEARDKRESLWRQWRETNRTLEELKNNWYYRKEDGLSQMRTDLGQIINQAGLNLPPIQYSYQDVEKGKIRKISFNFRLRTSYFALRELISQLEIFPKFLILEDLDFQSSGEEGGNLDLKLVISGFYVN